MASIGARVDVDGSVGTVRFIGTVQGTQGDRAAVVLEAEQPLCNHSMCVWLQVNGSVLSGMTLPEVNTMVHIMTCSTSVASMLLRSPTDFCLHSSLANILALCLCFVC
jgi:hypothetical protein